MENNNDPMNDIIYDLIERVINLEKIIYQQIENKNAIHNPVFKSKIMRDEINEKIREYAKSKQLDSRKLYAEIYREFRKCQNVDIYGLGGSIIENIETLGLLNIFRVFLENYLGEKIGDWQGDSEFPDNLI